MPRSSGPRLSQLDALAYIALYGSERKAAAATGVSRTVLNEAARGVREGGSKTVGTIAATVGDAMQATAQVVSGLIRALGGADSSSARQTGLQLAREQRAAPGVVQERATQHQSLMARVGLAPSGETLPSPNRPEIERPDFDKLGRPITDEQWANYQALQSEYEAGALSADRYERFVSMQLSSGSGGTGVPIADL